MLFPAILKILLLTTISLPHAAAISAQRSDPAIGQPDTDEGIPDDVVVTGRRIGREEARRQSARYVRGLAMQGSFGQTARWGEPLCIRTEGLTVSAVDQVDRAVAGIVRQSGAKVAEKPCRTNVFIRFTPDATRLLASIEKMRPRALAGASMAERTRLRDVGLPIRWWSDVAIRGRDGEALNTTPSTAIMDQAGTPLPVNEDTVWGGSYGSSLISTKINVETTSVVVLVDVPLVTGKKLSAIAAYVAFVALARVSIDNDAPSDSILSLFRPDYAGAGDLSANDRRYLSALSGMPRDRTAAWQRAHLVAAIAGVE